jgi:hypothetical protein
MARVRQAEFKSKEHPNKKPRYCEAFGETVGTRTQDPYIKSVLLYQLSYDLFHSLIEGAQK